MCQPLNQRHTGSARCAAHYLRPGLCWHGRTLSPVQGWQCARGPPAHKDAVAQSKQPVLHVVAALKQQQQQLYCTHMSVSGAQCRTALPTLICLCLH